MAGPVCLCWAQLRGRFDCFFGVDACRGGGMADAADLKSAGGDPVPVRVRPPADVWLNLVKDRFRAWLG